MVICVVNNTCCLSNHKEQNVKQGKMGTLLVPVMPLISALMISLLYP